MLTGCIIGSRNDYLKEKKMIATLIDSLLHIIKESVNRYLLVIPFIQSRLVSSKSYYNEKKMVARLIDSVLLIIKESVNRYLLIIPFI